MFYLISFIFFLIIFFIIYLFNPREKPKTFFVCFNLISVFIAIIYLKTGNLQSLNYYENLSDQIRNGQNLKPEELIIFLEKKIKDNPKDLEGSLILARSYLLSGYTQKAEKSYNLLIKDFPNNEDVLFEAALFKKKKKDIESSIKLLEKIKTLNEMNLSSRIFLTEVYIENKQLEEAKKEIRFIKKNFEINESVLRELENNLKN